MTSPQDAGLTGRFLVLLEDDSVAAGARAMSRVAGLRMASTADSAGASVASMLNDADGVILHELGVAVVSAAEDQASRLAVAAAEPGPIATVEAERIVHAITAEAPAEPAATSDENTFTWGLQAVRAAASTIDATGIRVAVLDTGFDVQHPDFAGRNVVTSSFIQGEDVQDGHGHGTHCIGTACGPRKPSSGPGYGVAFNADIYAGKVLSNRGSGSDGGILSGISWAISNGCAVVSMSLGAPTKPNTPFSTVFEQAAKRALDRGTLIIAAAGNESSRSAGHIASVGHPANCPSIMSVGAIDERQAITDFSCGTVDIIGQVDVVGPGDNVYSSWPGAQHKRLRGTSMATPHVAGIAALIAAQHGSRAWELWARLVQSANRLKLPATDVGAGLVQAP
ncbi:subtilisin family serine protease [Kibdelosporangium banguiense]|uniref:Subtilisin family serine protease n=1 Tax=Kibdelosporangium banguiense TaxID=1365924 RepID=A0ABS4TIZ4_9PSEU|nr:S8 family serine peptidase [Kibdelosporangium banguiense]MBP2323816.1 subtilisin family serine protease [Kibdelosporangium banguiense]